MLPASLSNLNVSLHVSLTDGCGTRDNHGHRSLIHCTCWSIGNHVRSRREKLCVQHYRSYQWNVGQVKRYACGFILCMKMKRFVILDICQNIISQFLPWVISPKCSPSKTLYCTVYNDLCIWESQINANSTTVKELLCLRLKYHIRIDYNYY